MVCVGVRVRKDIKNIRTKICFLLLKNYIYMNHFMGIKFDNVY